MLKTRTRDAMERRQHLMGLYLRNIRRSLTTPLAVASYIRCETWLRRELCRYMDIIRGYDPRDAWLDAQDNSPARQPVDWY